MGGWTAGRERAFIAELGASANVTVACEKARVARSAAYGRRERDARFAAAWDGAVASAEARIEEGEVVMASEDTIVRGSRGRRVQVARARPTEWTADKEARFLEALALSCNVRAATRAAGLGGIDVYRRRAQWPAFARAWEEALEAGYARLEAQLVEHATNLGGGASDWWEGFEEDDEGDGMAAAGAAAFDPRLALDILKAHWARVDRRGAGAMRGGRAGREPTLAEVQASVLRKLAALDRSVDDEDDDEVGHG